MPGTCTKIRNLHATVSKECLTRARPLAPPGRSYVYSRLKTRHRRAIVLSGGIGLFSCMLSDDQESLEDAMSVSSPGFCATWKRWSKSLGGGTVVAAESAYVPKGGRKGIEMSQKKFQFSPTLAFACFTIVENHRAADVPLAEQLKDQLPLSVSLTLGDAYSAAAEAEPLSTRRNPGELPNPSPSPSAVNDAIQEAFHLVNDAAPMALGNHVPNSSSSAPKPLEGTSVIMGVFNSEDHSFRVAVNGTCRAVYGRRVATSVECPEPSSHYQYEVEQLTPNRLLTNGTPFVGLNESGSSNDVCSRNSQPAQHDQCRTIPTIALKERVQPGDFVVMGNRQFWDCLQNEEASGLVGLWLEQTYSKKTASINAAGLHQSLTEISLPTMVTYTFSDLPIQATHHVPMKTTSTTSDRQANAVTKNEFICEDTTVGIHLMRNALRRGTMKPSPLSATIAEILGANDDSVEIACTIVFF